MKKKMRKNYTGSLTNHNPDITNRADLLKLMRSFYQKLLGDPSISYLFTDIARIDLDHHLPVLVDFWDNILFGSDTYRRNAMQPHMDLHAKSPILPSHFDTWLNYFSATVDELFSGETAFRAKERALSIATIMKIRVKQAG